ncbi:MAG: hypothetical protein K2J20_01330 [Bacilli bacterium]|nr:hypothetical protein [Bacilli bacterium]
MNKAEIIAKVNRAWPKDLIIRYLYVKLAPGFQRDVDFFRLPLEEQIALYNKGIVAKDDIHMVCQTICEYYQKLFAEFGIESIIIKTNNKAAPHHVLMVKGDSCYFAIDPLKDLMRNQIGMTTKYFGTIPISKTQDNRKLYPDLRELSSEYLKEMDIYLNLLSCGMYMDDFFNMLHESIFHRPNTRILEFLDAKDFDIVKLKQAVYPTGVANEHVITAKISLIDKCTINIGNCHGLLERDQFYDEILNHVFSRIERKQLKVGITAEKELYLFHLTDTTPALYIETQENGHYKLERKKKD